ncbi:MAG: GTP-binding protein [Ardenticatenaceae bacterium]
MVKSTVNRLKEYLSALFSPSDVAGDKEQLEGQRTVEPILFSRSYNKSHVTEQPSEDFFADHSHKKYFLHLIDQLNVIEIVNPEYRLRLPLEDIFVPPRLALAPYIPASHFSHLSTLGKVSKEQQSVWEFLSLERIPCLVILGAGGSGKTTLLKHMSLMLADPQKRLFSGVPKQLPILLSVRHHSAIIHAKSDYTLAEAAYHDLQLSPLADVLSANWFEEQLKTGQCLIMLDGLHEIADAYERERVVRWIELQIEENRENQFVITSRFLAYHNQPLKEAMILEMQPFNKEQIQLFVEYRFHAYQITPPSEKIEELIDLCLQPPFLMLSKNPLLLSMITTLYRYGISIPSWKRTCRSSVELYAQICDLVLDNNEHNHNHKTRFNLTSTQKRRVLQPLAYYMMRHKLNEIALDEASKVIYVPLDMVSRNPKGVDFLQLIARSSGFLIEQQNGQYSFAHLTFQEYLAATHILEQRLEDKLLSNVHNCWWHETSRLYCATSDATKLLAACLRTSELEASVQGPESPSLPALILAIACMQEAQTIQPETQNQLQNFLQQEVKHQEPIRRRIVAEALLSLRLSHMMPVNQNLYVADSLIMNAEYQLFVEEQRVKNAQPEDWWQLQYQFRAGAEKEPAIDLRPADAVAFCRWLTERDRSARSYRLPFTEEFEPLVSEVGYWTQGEMEQEYKLENEEQVVLSIDTLESRLRSALLTDLLCHPFDALRRVRDLDRDLDYILNHQHTGERAVAVALALVRDFAHDRTHSRLVNMSVNCEESDTSEWYASFVAWLVTKKLLTVLRHQQKPASWLDVLNPNPSAGSGHRLGVDAFQTERLNGASSSQKAGGQVRRSEGLAERYFELYVDLARLEKRIHRKSLTSRGIRIVAEHASITSQQEEAPKEDEQIESQADSPVVFSSLRQAVPELVEGQGTASLTGALPVAIGKKRKVIQKKICLLGDEAVGKTSLVRRCVEGCFDEKYLSTVGVTISRKTLVRETYTMNLLIWDMEGAPGFKKAQLSYLRRAAGALIVCDLTRYETLESFERYARQLRALNGKVPYVFIGNKVDLKGRTIFNAELETVCNTFGAPYILTSAKTGTQVMEGFELLADLIEKET